MVVPEYATNTHGNNHPEWVSRVNSHPNYSYQRRSGQVTCSSAIKVLFKMACAQQPNCSIEKEYRRQCVDRQITSQKAKKCEQVVRSYVKRCFGGNLELPKSVTMLQNRQDICSASLIQSDPLYREEEYRNRPPLFATARHCPVNGYIWCLNERELLSHAENPPLSNQEIQFLSARQTVPCGTAMPIQQPQEGVQTFFMGYNDLIAARNEVIRNNLLNAQRMSPFRVNSSPLCTIVKILNRGRLFHTCQSTKGGSGGALFQTNSNNRIYIVVGINEGAPNPGQVSHNLGQALLDN